MRSAGLLASQPWQMRARGICHGREACLPSRSRSERATLTITREQRRQHTPAPARQKRVEDDFLASWSGFERHWHQEAPAGASLNAPRQHAPASGQQAAWPLIRSNGELFFSNFSHIGENSFWKGAFFFWDTCIFWGGVWYLLQIRCGGGGGGPRAEIFIGARGFRGETPRSIIVSGCAGFWGIHLCLGRYR